jgi:hypothetical protein
MKVVIFIHILEPHVLAPDLHQKESRFYYASVTMNKNQGSRFTVFHPKPVCCEVFHTENRYYCIAKVSGRHPPHNKTCVCVLFVFGVSVCVGLCRCGGGLCLSG